MKKAAQFALKIIPPRVTFKKARPPRAPAAAAPAPYEPAPNAGARKRTSAEAELEEFQKLVALKRGAGAADADVAAAIHHANVALRAIVTAGPVVKRARMGVNPTAPGGSDQRRLVKRGKRKGAGVYATSGTHGVVPLTKAHSSPAAKKKKQDKHAVLVGTPAERAAKVVAAAKRRQASVLTAATFAATVGAATTAGMQRAAGSASGAGASVRASQA